MGDLPPPATLVIQDNREDGPRCQTCGPRFVGPLLGEFGHKLLSAGILRKMVAEGSRLTICDLPELRPIYADFCKHFVPHDIYCEGDGIIARADQSWAREAAARFVPAGMLHMIPHEYRGQPAIFYRYGTPIPEFRGAVVFHARARGHVAMRNWAAQNWHQLARWLFGQGAERIVCIGSRNAAMPAEGACDMRGADLSRQMDILASAWFAVGPSSGPMHLASLCGCPHVVWCGGGPAERTYTKRRYDHIWNPFGTPVMAQLYASWRPTFETVRGWVAAFMEKLGGYQDRYSDKPRTTHRGGAVLG